ncbi:MAG: AAA family ATPase [Alphaproteobacteria bacterium]|nr:AAA family ATPase [Alphaproteobacteria bacterium]MCB9792835.1 AAA family ATPase [Alphaproteobacteria bacterium]
MYVKSFTIENIKCFERVTLDMPRSDGGYEGWNVLLGDNGSGKSTLLQALALTLLGPVSGQRLVTPDSWPRFDTQFGVASGLLVAGSGDVTRRGGMPRKTPYKAELRVTGRDPVDEPDLKLLSEQPQLLINPSYNKSLFNGPYSSKPGWFSCGYGPFRRLTGGGGRNEDKVIYSSERESRYATLFFESAALVRSEEWLKNLYAHSIDPQRPDADRARADFEAAQRVINSVLPDAVSLSRVDTEKVRFKALGGHEVSIDALSDGYRAFLALVVDVLRHIQEAGDGLASHVSQTQGPRDDGESWVVDTEGVILIDEAGTHLHPTWQRELGFVLTEVFPKVQFIVTTHSPFVAMAAQKDGLFKLVTDQSGSVQVERPEQSVRGWRADQVLLSPLFGLPSTRDWETDQLIAQREALLAVDAPSAEQRAQLRGLEKELESRLSARGDTPGERAQRRAQNEYIQRVLAGLQS